MPHNSIALYHYVRIRVAPPARNGGQRKQQRMVTPSAVFFAQVLAKVKSAGSEIPACEFEPVIRSTFIEKTVYLFIVYGSFYTAAKPAW